MTAAGGIADTRRHYPVLDGLRGVAALTVVVWLGASAPASARTARVCAALGGLS